MAGQIQHLVDTSFEHGSRSPDTIILDRIVQEPFFAHGLIP